MSQEWMDKLASYTPDRERAQAAGRQQAEHAAAERARPERLVQLLEQLVAAQAEQTALLREILAAVRGQGTAGAPRE